MTGQVPAPPDPRLSPPWPGGTMLAGLYRSMALIRRFEDRVAGLERSGVVRAACPGRPGGEAVAAGVSAALRRDDEVRADHRSLGPYLARGEDVARLMSVALGVDTDQRASASARHPGPPPGRAATTPALAATIPLAVGAALAGKLRSAGAVTVVFFGAEAAAGRLLRESLDLAVAHRLPCLFVAEQDAATGPTTPGGHAGHDPLAGLATAHGLPAVRLDGGDGVAVFEAARAAVAFARRGDGPSLIECVVPRRSVEADRARGQAPRAACASPDADAGDPLGRCRRELLSHGVAESDITSIERRVEADVERAVRSALADRLRSSTSVRRFLDSVA